VSKNLADNQKLYEHFHDQEKEIAPPIDSVGEDRRSNIHYIDNAPSRGLKKNVAKKSRKLPVQSPLPH
jgi:hypothetical protein